MRTNLRRSMSFAMSVSVCREHGYGHGHGDGQWIVFPAEFRSRKNSAK
jgi:hypothetical protein